MRYAVIARCPVFGGSMRGYDAARALAVAGVREVLEVPAGVAVIADKHLGRHAGTQGAGVPLG